MCRVVCRNNARKTEHVRQTAQVFNRIVSSLLGKCFFSREQRNTADIQCHHFTKKEKTNYTLIIIYLHVNYRLRIKHYMRRAWHNSISCCAVATTSYRQQQQQQLWKEIEWEKNLVGCLCLSFQLLKLGGFKFEFKTYEICMNTRAIHISKFWRFRCDPLPATFRLPKKWNRYQTILTETDWLRSQDI